MQIQLSVIDLAAARSFQVYHCVMHCYLMLCAIFGCKIDFFLSHTQSMLFRQPQSNINEGQHLGNDLPLEKYSKFILQ